jgi:hypothetical protein
MSETPKEATDAGGDHAPVERLAADILSGAKVACAAIRTSRPPNTGRVRFDESVDAAALSICRTLGSAILVYESGDHDSAGALARKALETSYALILLQRKGDDAIPLLDVWCRRLIGAGLTTILETRDATSALDRDKIIAAVRDFAAKVPGGKLQRVTEADLARWAGLSEIHDKFYSLLNGHAHFDYLEAMALRDQVREPTGPDVQTNLVTERAKVALVILRVALLALHALRELGANDLYSLLMDTLGPCFDDWAEGVSILESARGLRNARLSGWAKD